MPTESCFCNSGKCLSMRPLAVEWGIVYFYPGSDACCVGHPLALLAPSWLLPTGKPRFGACLIALAAALPAAGGELLSWVALFVWD